MRLLIILVILLAAVGCAKSQPTVQSIVEPLPQWNGVTQYDYKAGAPNELSAPTEQPEIENTSPTELMHPWSYYFPEVYNPHHFETPSGGSGYSYYQPQPLPSVIFWQGSATITIQ
jgi:hypothetical protein